MVRSDQCEPVLPQASSADAGSDVYRLIGQGTIEENIYERQSESIKFVVAIALMRQFKKNSEPGNSMREHLNVGSIRASTRARGPTNRANFSALITCFVLIQLGPYLRT